MGKMLKSCMCGQAQLESELFQVWGVLLGEQPMRMHRKIWEFCYIAQALHERWMLAPGVRGIGFGVGREPLPALFASFGCEIVATDYGEDEARAAGWVGTGQYAGATESALGMLNERGLCEAETFKRNVTFRQADMRHLRPDDLGEFDFVWSACALEHLGSMAAGEHFIRESLRHLRPGGVAVHTTEYDVDSDADMRGSGPTLTFRDVQSNASWQTVLFGKRDLERVADDVRRMGYRIDLDFARGNLPSDLVIAQPPYQTDPHLKLNIEGHTATSFGLIIEKGGLTR